MGNESFYLKHFVEEKKLEHGSLIDKKELETYFVKTANISYQTMRNYFYILKMLGAIEMTKHKHLLKLNKNVLDTLRD